MVDHEKLQNIDPQDFDHDGQEYEEAHPFIFEPAHPSHGNSRVCNLVLGHVFAASLWFLGCILLMQAWAPAHQDFQRIYSPAQDAVRYVEHVFDIYGVPSNYTGQPTKEKNEAWHDLAIPDSEAIKLANNTLPIPAMPGYQVLLLDMFHALHCVNTMRKLVWWEHFGSWENIDPEQRDMQRGHLDHCVDYLRQTIQCNADVSPINYFYAPDDSGDIIPTLGNLHTCKDFESIRRWAVEHHLRVPLGNSKDHGGHQKAGWAMLGANKGPSQ